MITPTDRNAVLSWARKHGRPFTAIEAVRGVRKCPSVVRDAISDLIRDSKIRVHPQPKPFAAKHEVNP